MERRRLLGPVTWPARATSSAGLQAIDAALASSIVDRAVDRMLASGVVDRIVERMVSEGLVDRVIEQLLDAGIVERTVDRVIADLLESEELWLLVEAVAASPAVTHAVTQQTAGFADQVAGGVRARSHNADAWLERQARRALRRTPR